MSQFHKFVDHTENMLSLNVKTSLLSDCGAYYYSNNNLTTESICYQQINGNYISYNGAQLSAVNKGVLIGITHTGNDWTYGNILDEVVVSAYTAPVTKAEFIYDISDLNWSNSSYSTAYTNLITTHGNIIATRNELDRKMDAVYSKNDTTLELQNSVYTTLFWTVLATSLLYFLFIHL